MTRLNSVASSLAMLACFACAEGAPNVDIDPASTPDAGVADANEGREGASDPELAASWRDHPMFRSGSRLLARVLDGGGGAAAFVGFRDRMLARDCEFAIAADGERRCLPVARDGMIYYLDAACASPVFRQSTGTECKDSVGPYVTQRSGVANDCGLGPRTRVFAVGAPRSDDVVYAAIGGKCEAVGQLDCLHDAAEAEPAQFARGALMAEASGEGFAIEWVETEDGARAIAGLRDTVHDVACSVQPEIRSDACLPLSEAQVLAGAVDATGALFGEDGCRESRAVLDSGRDGCTPASMIVLSEPTACGTFELSAFELGPVIDAAFAKTGSGCRAFSPPTGQKVYAVGDPLQLEARPAVQTARIGTERLALRYFATADGTPIQYDALRFYDWQLLRTCERQVMADGTTRCVPVGRSAAIDPAGPFLDDECTEQLVAVLDPELPETCALTPEYAQRVAAESTLLAEVYKLGARLRTTPKTVYFQTEGTCTGRNPRPLGYHRLGAKLELAVLREQLY